MTATLLTVERLREFIDTDELDPALQTYLDSEEAEIIRLHGPHATASETLAGGRRNLLLSRPANSVTTVSEILIELYGSRTVALVADDWRFSFSSRSLERLTSGTNPRLYWGARVEVAYVPESDNEQRTLGLVNLCKLAIEYRGVASERFGDVSRNMGDYTSERMKLLRSINPRVGFRFA